MNNTKFSGLLRKALAFFIAAAMIGVALMFSALLFVVILAVVLMAWIYLWWKTRDLRKQMRDLPNGGWPVDAGVSDDVIIEEEITRNEVFKGEVIEGEVVRVADPDDVR